MKNPDAIFTADWHLRDSKPKARTDDFISAQWKKVSWVFGRGVEYRCPIFIAGDFGHKPYWPNRLLRLIIERLMVLRNRLNVFVLAGQHDLPNHRLDRLEDSGLGVLNTAFNHRPQFLIPDTFCNELTYIDRGDFIVYFFHFGEKIQHPPATKKRQVALAHQMVIERVEDYPGQFDHGDHAGALLKKFPEYDLIVVGDNHKTFVVEEEGRIVLSPGSLMRTTAAQIKHRPSIFLWRAKDNQLEQVFLPIEKDVLSREHIKEEKERDKRIEAFISSLDSNYEVDISFEENLKAGIRRSKIRKSVQTKIWEAYPDGQ